MKERGFAAGDGSGVVCDSLCMRMLRKEYQGKTASCTYVVTDASETLK